MKGRFARFLCAFWADYAVFAALLAVNLVFDSLQPFQRPWSADDSSLAHPYANPELVPTWLLVVLAVVVPVVVVAVVGGVLSGWHAAHHGLVGLAINLVLALAVTNGTKNLVGRHRPDFLARCAPDMATVTAAVTANATAPPAEAGVFRSGLVVQFYNAFCTATDAAKLEDGSRSFPSGHSSMAFAGLGYLTLFLLGVFQTLAAESRVWTPLSHAHELVRRRLSWRRPATWFPRAVAYDSVPLPTGSPAPAVVPAPVAPSEVGAPLGTLQAEKNAAAAHAPLARFLQFDRSTLGLVVALLPVFTALFIALSRVHDSRHFPTDVIAGSLIGIATAVSFYRWFHAPLGSPLAGMPKAPRWQRATLGSRAPRPSELAVLDTSSGSSASIIGARVAQPV